MREISPGMFERSPEARELRGVGRRDVSIGRQTFEMREATRPVSKRVATSSNSSCRSIRASVMGGAHDGRPTPKLKRA